MELRQLGRTDIQIGPMILGTWAIGGWMWGGTNEKDSIEAIQASLERGVNTLDTAAIYGMGYSEEIVAKAIKGRRDQVVIATKCGMRWDSQQGSDPWLQKDMKGQPVIIRKNSKPESIVLECENSLKRLGVQVIDLYQIHWPDPSTSIEDSWEAMARLKKEGKVRAIGVSNYSLKQLQKAHAVYPVDSIQPPYSLIRRDIEKDILPFCKQNQISVIVYSPLERGLLTGKIAKSHHFPEGDHREKSPTFSPENREKVARVLDIIRPIAEKYGVTLSQLIIQSTFQQPGITAAIVGARNKEQAIENAAALNFELSSEEHRFIVEQFESCQLGI